MKDSLVAGGITLIFFGIGSSFGPFGITVAGFLLVIFGLATKTDTFASPRKVECDACGRKNYPEDATCHHCGTVLSGK
ncbi:MULTISPECIES: hypothetical protein [unclassified Haladaptatus]|uniref:hypothetical protein n=1 Tax=unclassified Haladaptatus TaxID=2622732 RepID=UPI00209C142C|nr:MULTISPECIES: hypothetical protein [unclassified Haladaptatus]MCO8245215.1 hypothetical protein [Haladaptatus sp. AB643]MCO8253359.1 hypothetical protein [Haladaptatus sp. AB618]